jgi:hypothetical protein
MRGILAKSDRKVKQEERVEFDRRAGLTLAPQDNLCGTYRAAIRLAKKAAADPFFFRPSGRAKGGSVFNP